MVSAVAVRARYIFPVSAPPIVDGAVTIARGRIVAVGPPPAGAPVLDLENTALLPALVNAHTHLEFSDLAEPLAPPNTPFPRWIERVIAHRRRRAGHPEFARRNQEYTVSTGCWQLLRHATAAVGEIATPGFSTAPFASAGRERVGGLSATVFLELLGLAPEREAELLALARAHLAAASAPTEPDPLGREPWRAGLGPHAPYTASPTLVREACALARAAGAPVAMHLAETPEELELLASHSGPLVDFLSGLGAWRPDVVPRGLAPLDYLRWLAEAERALVIHGNYLTADEIGFVAARRDRMSLVYCPRTHAYFGHCRYPLDETLRRGARVALGTDSRASNPDLNLWEEMRFVARANELPLDQVLRLGTLNGAEALGLADQFGSIEVGKPATLALVELDESDDEPHEALFRGQIGRFSEGMLDDAS